MQLFQILQLLDAQVAPDQCKLHLAGWTGEEDPLDVYSRQTRMLDIREVVIAPRSPWQNAYAERVIGSIDASALTMS